MLGSDARADVIEPPRAAHWGFWGTLIWGAVILTIEFLIQVMTMIAVVLWRKGDITKLSNQSSHRRLARPAIAVLIFPSRLSSRPSSVEVYSSAL